MRYIFLCSIATYFLRKHTSKEYTVRCLSGALLPNLFLMFSILFFSTIVIINAVQCLYFRSWTDNWGPLVVHRTWFLRNNVLKISVQLLTHWIFRSLTSSKVYKNSTLHKLFLARSLCLTVRVYTSLLLKLLLSSRIFLLNNIMFPSCIEKLQSSAKEK